MKKIYLLALSLTVFSAAKAQTTIIDDNFESYPLGGLNNAHWKNWYLTDPDDALDIVVTDRKAASSSTKSGYIGVYNEQKGQDAILVMPNVFTKGTVTTEWKMFVPADSVAYFNLQETATPGEAYGFDCTINGYGLPEDTLADGTSLGNKFVWTFISANSRFVFGYAPLQTNQWVTVKQVINLDNSTLNVYVDGTEINYYYYKTDTDLGNTYPGENKSVASFDLYSLPDTSNNNGFFSTYYIDDVKVITENVNSIKNVEKNSNLVSLYPNPSKDYINLSVKDEKITNIEVFNISGQKVLNVQPNTSIATVNIQSLASGVYTAKVGTKAGTFTKEFIVK